MFDNMKEKKDAATPTLSLKYHFIPYTMDNGQ